MLDIACSEADKDLERQKKEERKAALTNILRKVQKIQDSLTKSSDIDYQQFIRQQMMNCRVRIQETETKIIDEVDFDSLQKKEKDAGANYGSRDVVLGPLEAKINHVCPFITQKLMVQEFSQIFFTTDNFSINQGIFTSGKQNGSSLRFMVGIEQNYDGLPTGNNLRVKDDDRDSDSDQNSYDGELSDEDSDDAMNGRFTVGAAGFGFGNGLEEFSMTSD